MKDWVNVSWAIWHSILYFAMFPVMICVFLLTWAMSPIFGEFKSFPKMYWKGMIDYFNDIWKYVK